MEIKYIQTTINYILRANKTKIRRLQTKILRSASLMKIQFFREDLKLSPPFRVDNLIFELCGNESAFFFGAPTNFLIWASLTVWYLYFVFCWIFNVLTIVLIAFVTATKTLTFLPYYVFSLGLGQKYTKMHLHINYHNR